MRIERPEIPGSQKSLLPPQPRQQLTMGGRSDANITGGNNGIGTPVAVKNPYRTDRHTLKKSPLSLDPPSMHAPGDQDSKMSKYCASVNTSKRSQKLPLNDCVFCIPPFDRLAQKPFSVNRRIRLPAQNKTHYFPLCDFIIRKYKLSAGAETS